MAAPSSEDEPLSRSSSHWEYHHLLGIVTAVVVVSALYFARVVFIPLALAILVAVVLTPAVSFLERLRLPRGLAILGVILALIGLAGALAWTVAPQFADVMEHLPEYEQAIGYKVDKLKGATVGKFGRATESVKSFENDITSKAPNTPLGVVPQAETQMTPSTSQPMPVQVVSPSNPLDAAAGLAGPVATGIAVLVFAVFILTGREDLRNRLIKLTSGGRLTVMTQAMAEAWNRINRYLFMQMLVNCAYGLTTGIALHFLGVPKASLWGFSAGLLRYLPYIGWPTAALLPTCLALAVFPGWGHAIITFCIFAGLEFLMANGAEPLLYGAHVGLAPLAILISAIFWTLIWGFPGLLLSTPMTVCLTVVGRYVPGLSFLSILLGNEPVMDPHAQYYQRLLAGDETEARQILETYLKENSLEDLFELVLIRALARSEGDAHRNELDEETRIFVDNTTRQLAEEMSASHLAETTSGSADSLHLEGTVLESERLNVLCVPARDEADEVAATLLCDLLERRGVRCESLPIASSAEMLGQVAEMRPEIVCISALPPLAMNHMRTLYARLRTQRPGMPIIVCLWRFEGGAEKMARILRLGTHDRFFTTLVDALGYFSGQESAAPVEVSEEPHPV